MLLPARGPAATPSPAPFYREIIADHIGYLRPGDLNRDALSEVDVMLHGLVGKKVDALIFDLRGSGETNDYGMAAEFASRFVPKGKPLFTCAARAARNYAAFSPARIQFIMASSSFWSTQTRPVPQKR
jgi:C-terminal processing protease CtpA/Prc